MADPRRKPIVLFLCTGNSCRSQMAEGFARALKTHAIDAYSAGTSPHGLNPLAVRAMREAGIDISGHNSKSPDDLAGAGVRFDVVVAVCDSAHQSCPVIPGVRIVHAPFDDPPRLAARAADDEEAMTHYRRVRDEIRAWIETLPESLNDTKEPAMNTQTTNATNEPASCGCGPSCCGGEAVRNAAAIAAQTSPDEAAADAMREKVREGYGQIARSGGWNAASESSQSTGCCSTSTAAPKPKSSTGCCGSSSAAPAAAATSAGAERAGGGCCGPATFSPEQLAAAIGYSQADLAATPETANMGLSCGNPTAIAALKPGEVVIDLGSGGGFDCFVAGPKVGAAGRVIGVDMTPDMLSKARCNIAAYTAQSGLSNVEFRLGEIENIPVADATADVVISNCVLNLSPDKPRVWKEIARVLKQGGRVAVSDLALLRPLPESVKADVEALIGCIAGAVLVEETRAQMTAAGLADIVLTPKPSYIDAMTDWQDPLYRKIIDALPQGAKPGDYITSLDIAARRP